MPYCRSSAPISIASRRTASSAFSIAIIECAINGAGGCKSASGGLMRCTRLALLVDHDGRGGIFDRLAEIGRERPDLLGIADVAGEEDQPPGPLRGEEIALLGRQRMAGAAGGRKPAPSCGRGRRSGRDRPAHAAMLS